MSFFLCKKKVEFTEEAGTRICRVRKVIHFTDRHAEKPMIQETTFREFLNRHVHKRARVKKKKKNEKEKKWFLNGTDQEQKKNIFRGTCSQNSRNRQKKFQNFSKSFFF